MKRFLYITILLTVFSWLSASASVHVTNLYLEKTSQFTQFVIECDQDFEYHHLIVEKSADRPLRIVVDIFDALHSLPKYNFGDLPKSSIKQIRTSQFSVDPTKTVRVVLDVAGTLTYKVNKKENILTLFINTPNDQDFPRWTAAPVKSNAPLLARQEKPLAVPAQPGNEANTPPVDYGEPGKENLQLSGQPIAVKEEPAPAKPFSVVEPETSKPTELRTADITTEELKAFAAVFSGVAEQPPPRPERKTEQAESVATSRSSPLKTAAESVKVGSELPSALPLAPRHIDSAESQPDVPQQGMPVSDSVLKPPKSEKTPFPEIRINKRPKLVEREPIDEAVDKTAVTTPPPEAPKTKSEIVRQKYLAKKRQEDKVKSDETALPERVPDAVDKIREKYRRGIKFVRDDQDEQRLAEAESRDAADADQLSRELYDEYIPQREIVIYATDGCRDPFFPLIQDAALASEKSRLPDVESLRLIGVLQDVKVSRALFEDFNGYAYILQVGDRVKNGFLVSITEDYVTFQIRQYGWSRKIALTLEEEI